MIERPEWRLNSNVSVGSFTHEESVNMDMKPHVTVVHIRKAPPYFSPSVPRFPYRDSGDRSLKIDKTNVYIA